MLEWKRSDPKYNESVFAINFREELPQLAEQLMDKGYFVDGKTTSENGWTYKAKKVTSKKNGKEYWFIERWQGELSEEEKAHQSTNKEYSVKPMGQTDAYQERQKHIDELAERKLAILERIALSLEKVARCVDDSSGTLHIRNARDLEGE